MPRRPRPVSYTHLPDWPYGDNYTEQMLNRYLPMAVLDEQFQASDVHENLITEYMGRSWYKGSETYTSPYFVTDPDFTEYNVDDSYSCCLLYTSGARSNLRSCIRLSRQCAVSGRLRTPSSRRTLSANWENSAAEETMERLAIMTR